MQFLGDNWVSILVGIGLILLVALATRQFEGP